MVWSNGSEHGLWSLRGLGSQAPQLLTAGSSTDSLRSFEVPQTPVSFLANGVIHGPCFPGLLGGPPKLCVDCSELCLHYRQTPLPQTPSLMGNSYGLRFLFHLCHIPTLRLNKLLSLRASASSSVNEDHGSTGTIGGQSDEPSTLLVISIRCCGFQLL